MKQKQKKNKLRKEILIILLVCVPTAMLFGFLINNTQARINIPEEDNKNNWHWHDDIVIGEELAYEVEFVMKYLDTEDLFMQSKYLEILKIDNIDNTTINMMGPTPVSQISATRMFYNCTKGDTEPLPDLSSVPIVNFGYNISDEPHERFFTGDLMPVVFFPLILPFNETGFFDASLLTNILNTTFYHNLYDMGVFNRFDEKGNETINSELEKIWFKNSTDNYFCNLTYFSENGTLQYGEAKFLMSIEDEGVWMIVELKMKRVFPNEYDITDEVEWGVNVGDELYFGHNEEEVAVNITDIRCMTAGFMLMDDMIYQSFELVFANFSMWNGEEYVPDDEMSEILIGIANNFYPIHPMAMMGEEEEIIILLMPNNTELEDLKLVFNNYTNEDMGWPFNEVLIHDETIIELTSESQNFKVITFIDNKTGIIKMNMMEKEGMLDYVTFRKNMTTLGVDQNVEPLWSDLVGVNRVTINVTMSARTDLYWAVLPVNPLEPEYGRFPYEVPGLELYIDVYVNETANVMNGNVNFTINYDDQPLIDAGIEEIALKVYAFNLTDNNEWSVLDPSNFTVVPGSDTIHVHTKGGQYFSIGLQEAWNWSSEINVDDLLIYETLGDLSGPMPDVGEITIPFISHVILNVTDIGLVNTTKYEDIKQEINQINASMMLWDPEVKRLVHDKSHEGVFSISEYYYNKSSDPSFFINPQEFLMGIPIVVPLRWERLYLPEIARSLNESFYSSDEAREMGLPIWDDITVNSLTNSILFNETSSDYFMEITYYDNGTLMGAEMFFTINISGDFIEFNLTNQRLFDYNTTDEVEWGVEVGDSIYYGSNFPEGGPTMEMNITIVKFNQTTVWLADLFEFGGDAFMFNAWLTFENVWADIQFWNATNLENGEQKGEWIYMDTTLIAAANNYFPFAPGNYGELHGLEFMAPVLAPVGVDGYDLAEDYLDLMTFMLMMWTEGELISTVAGVDTNYARIDLRAPSEPDYEGYIEWYLDNNTGITRLFYMYEELGPDSVIVSAFKKNYTGVFSTDDEKFMFDNALVSDVNVSIRIGNDNGYDYEFMEALLHKNPVNSSMPSGIGTPMFFTDIFLINHTSDRNAYNLTFYIELPSKYEVGYVKYLAYYMYDLTDPEESKWGYDTLENIFGVERYTSNNSLVLRLTKLNGSLSIILAWMYSPLSSGGALAPAAGDDDDDDDEVAAAIPGYDIYLLLLFMSLISIVIVLERRKRIKI